MLESVAIVSVKAQEKQSITGKLVEEKSNQPVSFATVTLIKTSDLSISGGAMSDENGVFKISPVIIGNYMLRVSNIGYKPATKNIDVINKGITDAGIIYLRDTSIMLNELVIVGERVKAKSESDRTTFYVTKKMLDASNTGTDMLKLVPGIQVDLMHNISLEGSSDILIYVEGKERDKSYISQLNPNQIDRIEVISVLPSNYDGNLTGAINIILKKDRDSGINGHVFAEIPTSSVVYVFPTFSLNYGFKKLNLYTSYNGEMAYFDVHEKTYQKRWNDSEMNEINSNQYVRQKNWSNRLNYGFDYFLSDHDQINLYAFYNPFSRELDGTADSELSGTINNYWQASKEDKDINTGNFHSIYYKHSFYNGSEIAMDISNYHLEAENSTEYVYEESDNVMVTQTNSSKPQQNVMSMKLDYTSLSCEKLNFSTGAKARFQVLDDRINNFDYNENVFALYGNIAYKQAKYDLSLGLRAEKSIAEMRDSFRNPFLAFLPYASLRYKLTSKQNIQLSYNRSVKRPNLYQLNPFTSVSDPYTIRKGNPILTPELLGSFYLEHSLQFNGNYIASRLFFNRTSDVINSLSFINDTSALETQVHNLGDMSQYGIQFSGSLKLRIMTFNPYIKVSGLTTSGNDLAEYYLIKNTKTLRLESGLSAIASFKHDLALTLTFQYSSPKSDIQGKTFSDMLYFLSMEKTFKQRFKVGIVSAVPFLRSFTYAGSETKGSDFYTHYEGNLKMPVIPFWFKLGYRFSSGKNREKINRSREEIDIPKKGF